MTDMGRVRPGCTWWPGSFAALADPARLRLLSMIAAQPGGEVCALVDKDKRGTWVWYRVLPERLAALQIALALDGVPFGEPSGDCCSVGAWAPARTASHGLPRAGCGTGRGH